MNFDSGMELSEVLCTCEHRPHDDFVLIEAICCWDPAFDQFPLDSDLTDYSRFGSGITRNTEIELHDLRKLQRQRDISATTSRRRNLRTRKF